MHETQLRWALVATLALVLVLIARDVALRLRVSARVEEQVAAWRERELGRVQQQLERAAETRARALYEQWRGDSEGDIRRDAVSRSRGVIAGKVVEHLAPYLAGFPYNPKDARFLGSPVDLVVFDGLDEGRLRGVVFVEIKTGAGTLTARERAVRDAVRAGRVVWDEWRPTPPRES